MQACLSNTKPPPNVHTTELMAFQIELWNINFEKSMFYTIGHEIAA